MPFYLLTQWNTSVPSPRYCYIGNNGLPAVYKCQSGSWNMQYPLSEKTASTASFNLHVLIHRITGVGRDLGRWSNSTFFCSQKGQLKQAAQGHVQSGFECFLEWTLHNQSGQPVPVFNHPHGERYFHIHFITAFGFVLIASCPFTPHYWEGSVFFTTPIRYLCTLVRFPSAFCSSEWTDPTLTASHDMLLPLN